jgi:hypothetical protein
VRRKENEDKIIRYLLGELPEQEQLRLEERYFGDAEFFDQFLVMEDQLIDDYLRGQLSRRDKERFEKHFLSSPRGRERVKLARVLIRAVSEPMVVATPARPAPDTGTAPSRAHLLPFWRVLSLPTKLMAATAALLILIVGAWVAVENVRLRNQLRQLQAKQTAQQEREQELRQQLADALRDQPPQQIPPEQSGPDLQAQVPGQPSAPSVLSFALTPGLQRDGGGMNRLVIPRGTRSLQIKLNFETDGQYRIYNVVLKMADGAELRRLSNLRAASTRSGKLIVLNLSPAMLAKGEYVISLSGVTASGDDESIEDYSFSVARK